MEESSTIVANRTHGLGNRSCESSEGNALAVARRGHAGGLASGWAVTSWNRLKRRKEASHERGLWDSEYAKPVRGRRRPSPRASWMNAPEGILRRRGDGTATWIGMQSRDVPHLISVAAGMRNANSGRVWRCGTAHEAIVAMMPMITSGWSEGPLGCRGLDAIET